MPVRQRRSARRRAMPVSWQPFPLPCDAMTTHYPTIADCIGNTPLVRLQRMPGKTSNTILVKLEGNNPAGSVKDRRSEEHTSELQSLMRISYAVFCLKKHTTNKLN